MAQTLKFGNGNFATKAGSTLCYDDQNGNFKPIPMDFTRASTATRVNKQGLIEVVKSNVPRIDYTDTSDGVLLLENAATNNILYSQKISLTPTKNGTFVDNFAISPDGTQNATKLTATDTDPFFYQSVSFSAGSYTASIYVKGIGNSIGKNFEIRLGLNSSAQIEIPSEWTRIEYTATMTSGSASFGIEIPNPAVVGDEVLVWGWQLEQNSVASSYIPTQGSAVTRVAETASGSGNSEVFNDSEGVLFADIAYPITTSGSGNKRIAISNGTSSNRVMFAEIGNTGISALITSGGVNSAYITGNVNNLLYGKSAIKYKQNDFALWINGFEVGTDTSGSAPVGLSELAFDGGDNTNPFYGSTKEIGYYDTALTDLELETLTSYRTWTSMVNELNLNIIYNG
jgi:hypothetical protein